jgi:hypothetical protein
MSTEEMAPEATPQATEGAPAPAAAPASSRTRPSSTVPAANPKKKVARPSNGGGRKSTSGAATPKKTAASAVDRSFKYGDIVLARLKGYPPWREFLEFPCIRPGSELTA